MIDKKVILFGASVLAKQTTQLLEIFGIEVEVYLDNDSKKWDKNFMGKQITKPTPIHELFKQENRVIVIASMFLNEISEQLTNMGYMYNKDFFSLGQFIINLIETNDLNLTIQKPIELHRNRQLLLTFHNGIVLGGVETWNFDVHSRIKESFLVDMCALNENNKVIQESGALNIVNIPAQCDGYKQRFQKIIDCITEHASVTVVPNSSPEMFVAAIIAKKQFVEQIDIVSVVHGDQANILDMNRFFNRYLHKIICVSNELEDKLKALVPERQADIITMISPIDQINYKNFDKRRDECLNIGFVSRLIKEQKRCDLLMEVIKLLSVKTHNYRLYIAGEGEYFSIIEDFIREHNLEDHIILCGFIKHAEIDQFWRDKDIYLNISDYEGTSLSMLEAMSNGVVPVVTRVSGVNRFVQHGYNGYIFEPQDITACVQIIMQLIDNKQDINRFSDRCVNKIKDECNPQLYINSLKKIMNLE